MPAVTTALSRLFPLIFFFGLSLPLLAAGPYNRGAKLNTFARITSASAVAFLEKHGITLADLIQIGAAKGKQNKELVPLLNTLKAADFPYAFFYTNENLFRSKLPAFFGVKVANAGWLTLIRAGLETTAGRSGDRLKKRFYVVKREGIAIEMLPDGIVFMPLGEAETMPEIPSVQALHDAIAADLGIKPDDGLLMEYHEQSDFSDLNERIRILFQKRMAQLQTRELSADSMAMMNRIIARLQKNLFLQALMSTKKTSLRIDIRNDIRFDSEYMLSDPSRKAAFLKTMSAFQVLGSIAMTFVSAGAEAYTVKIPATDEKARIGMDLLTKFSDSFNTMEIAEKNERISVSWKPFSGQDLVPVMQLAKKAVDAAKAELNQSERLEIKRDEVCSAVSTKDKKLFLQKLSEYQAMLPKEEHKAWRVSQVCADGFGILLTALEWGGEDTFLKLNEKLGYYSGSASGVNKTGKTYLHIAVERNYARALKKILADGIRNNQADQNGKTPLLYAIEAKNAKVVKQLLDGGITIISDDDVTLDAKTQKAAEACGDAEVLRLINEALKREKATRKKHQTQS